MIPKAPILTKPESEIAIWQRDADHEYYSALIEQQYRQWEQAQIKAEHLIKQETSEDIFKKIDKMIDNEHGYNSFWPEDREALKARYLKSKGGV